MQQAADGTQAGCSRLRKCKRPSRGEPEMSRLHRRSFLVLAGAAGAGSALAVSSPAIVRAATPVKMTLPWLPLGTFSYAFVAKKMGFWEKRGLDVTIDRGFGSGKVCVPVDQGQYDFGILDLAVMMNCAGRGLDLVAVAGIWPRSPVGIFSLKEYSINKPKDLEGQTVAFDVGSGDFQLWPAFVKATGIDDSKVNKVTMDAAALIKVLVEKQVKAEGNFFGSIAPSLWAQGLEINSILYEDYGIKMLSNVVACKRSTIEKRPELCQGFVEGLMDGLKYVYLNPEKSVQIHLESVKEFQGGSVANQKVIEYGQAVSTALGTVAAFKNNGLGYMEPALVEQTARTVETYMGVKNLPKTDTMFTNKFVGSARLTDAEWKSIEERSAKYLPKGA
ncbi:MAG TPA: ABC transporter substrate-binding protein [Xanthobacteraceae bacterium]|nr:ABC transporter substrate-binding protein [Xanthobacteraceae bacterium]